MSARVEASPDGGAADTLETGDEARVKEKSDREKSVRPIGLRANETDRYIGQRICERRLLLGLTQKELADQIGVTYQQVHKYERATNRITVGRLYSAAVALGVTVVWFFEGLETASPTQDIPIRARLSLELMRNVSEIQNEDHLEALSKMVIALARPTRAKE